MIRKEEVTKTRKKGEKKTKTGLEECKRKMEVAKMGKGGR